MAQPNWNLLHRDTQAVRVAVERSQYGENSEALYLTSGYVQPSAEAGARRFAGEEEGYTYARAGNPTVTSFEQRLAALEGTEAAVSTSGDDRPVTGGDQWYSSLTASRVRFTAHSPTSNMSGSAPNRRRRRPLPGCHPCLARRPRGHGRRLRPGHRIG